MLGVPSYLAKLTLIDAVVMKKTDKVIPLIKYNRVLFHKSYSWMFLTGEASVPDEWLQYLVPLCELANKTIPANRREDFKMDVFCDRGDYPMSIDVLLEPSDIDMTAIEQSIEEALDAVRRRTL